MTVCQGPGLGTFGTGSHLGSHAEEGEERRAFPSVTSAELSTVVEQHVYAFLLCFTLPAQEWVQNQFHLPLEVCPWLFLSKSTEEVNDSCFTVCLSIVHPVGRQDHSRSVTVLP